MDAVRIMAADHVLQEKSVLVCIGNVNRPVSFLEGDDNEDEKKHLYEAIKNKFSDILDNNSVKKPIIMVKSEEWNNEFVDIGSNPIPDRAVVRVVEAVSIETIIMLIMYLI